MTIKPIDIKTNLLANDDASRIREAQKAHEAGLAENVKQNKDQADHKAESVQKTDATEDKIVRREDEEEKKAKKQSKSNNPNEQEDEDEEKKKHPPIPDGVRGLKIDVKI